MMRKLFGLAVVLALVSIVSAQPANAQSISTPPVVVDRNAFTLTYAPFFGASVVYAAVSYQLSPGPWDLLFSYASLSGFATNPTAFRVGGRYHVQPAPSPTLDVYGIVQYFSPSAGNSHFELGGGFTDTVAPGLKLYFVTAYNSQTLATTNPYMSTNLGVQYQINRQWALVAGLEGGTVAFGAGYLGINYDFSLR
jgi:hypothetical protein